jgi:hypothetical protein
MIEEAQEEPASCVCPRCSPNIWDLGRRSRKERRKPQRFTVRGSGAFPVHMLAQERAWPADTISAAIVGGLMALGQMTPRTVRLARYPESDCDLPDYAAWEKAGWSVSHESD